MTSTKAQHDGDAVVQRLKEEALRRIEGRHEVDLEPGAVARDAGVDAQDAARHFPDQEALMSALIVGAYNAVADSAEAAAEAAIAAGADPLRRWVAIWQGVREWAVAHPEEYVMLWGRPIPGYTAPPETVEAVGRIVGAMVAVLRDARKAGELTEDRPGEAPLSDGMLQNVRALGSGPLEGLPSGVVARMFVVWTQLHGMVGFEVNNHLAAVAVDPASVFEYGAGSMGEYIGLRRRADQ
ncbi:TetR-like C-terminal domain-containing protein [Streptomyces aurantiacus]|uniref:TetR-like C-terminal domain-containing protein n=1 Tax=Streptomyces aurantiacus TaxID=47760 RepID=UPI0007C64784|nr:TetR-like C-terminal domain-containing protein [Streptomyces aurantiacus]